MERETEREKEREREALNDRASGNDATEGEERRGETWFDVVRTWTRVTTRKAGGEFEAIIVRGRISNYSIRLGH